MNDVFLRLKDMEKRKIFAIVKKRGIECSIKPVIKNDNTINDYDLFYDENIEVIKENQEEKFSYSFGDTITAKVLFLYDSGQFFEMIDDDGYQNNINAEPIRCLIDYEGILQVGSIIEIFDNIRYKITRIEKYRGLSDVPYYHILRT